MPKLSPLKAEQVIRKLRKLGFEGPIAGGRHSRMVHSELPIPMHKGKDVSVGLIRAIMREIDVSPDKWFTL